MHSFVWLHPLHVVQDADDQIVTEVSKVSKFSQAYMVYMHVYMLHRYTHAYGVNV